MKNAPNTEMTAPVWLWIALGVGILMLIGATWWASSVKHQMATSTSPDEPIGAGPAPLPRVTAPIGDIQTPPPGVLNTGPKITMTPPQIMPAPKPMHIPVAAPTPKQINTTKAVSHIRSSKGLAGLFPFGPITPRAQTISISPKLPDPPKPTVEQFPNFKYGKEDWRFTGAYADAGQLSLTPTGLELNGRSVFTLSGADEPASALFVESKTEPGKYAIYRKEDSAES